MYRIGLVLFASFLSMSVRADSNAIPAGQCEGMISSCYVAVAVNSDKRAAGFALGGVFFKREDGRFQNAAWETEILNSGTFGRSDVTLVRLSRFKRFEGCWPIEKLDVLGHDGLVFSYHFNANGSGRFSDPAGLNGLGYLREVPERVNLSLAVYEWRGHYLLVPSFAERTDTSVLVTFNDNGDLVAENGKMLSFSVEVSAQRDCGKSATRS